MYACPPTPCSISHTVSAADIAVQLMPAAQARATWRSVDGEFTRFQPASIDPHVLVSKLFGFASATPARQEPILGRTTLGASALRILSAHARGPTSWQLCCGSCPSRSQAPRPERGGQRSIAGMNAALVKMAWPAGYGARATKALSS